MRAETVLFLLFLYFVTDIIHLVTDIGVSAWFLYVLCIIYWGKVPDRFVPITCIDTRSDRYWGECLVCVCVCVCTDGEYKG